MNRDTIFIMCLFLGGISATLVTRWPLIRIGLNAIMIGICAWYSI